MADIINSVFRRKKVCLSKLEPYGFRREKKDFVLRRTLNDSGFELTVMITEQSEVRTKMIDPLSGDIYALHLTDRATGGFVGGVRTEYEQILTDISDKCFEPEVFKSEQAKELIRYVRERYGDELEFLWERFSDNAVWRRKDNAKWYAVILTVSRRKLGLSSDDTAEIIDMRYPPQKMDRLIDSRFYFPGWHMNKKNWFSVILDGSVDLKTLQELIDQSYRLAKK